MAARKSEREVTIKYVGGEPSEKPLYYVNNVQLVSGVFDVQIRLNRVVDIEGNELQVVCQGTAAMSPQHARALVRILSKGLIEYEKKYGKIPTQGVDAVYELEE